MSELPAVSRFRVLVVGGRETFWARLRESLPNIDLRCAPFEVEAVEAAIAGWRPHCVVMQGTPSPNVQSAMAAAALVARQFSIAGGEEPFGEDEMLQHALQLIASERYLRSLLDASPAGLLLAAEDGRIVRANLKCEAVFGYTTAELETMEIEDLIPPSLRADHGAMRRKFVQGETSRRMAHGRKVQGVRKDGTLVKLEVGLAHFLAGDVSETLVTIVDVSEAAALRLELGGHLTEQRRRMALLDASADVVLAVQVDGTLSYANRGALRLLAPEGAGLGSIHTVLADPATFLERTIPRVLSGRTTQLELRFVDAAGEDLILDCALRRVLTSDGDVDCIGVVGRDISDKVALALLTESSRHKLDQILATIPMGVFIVDKEGTPQYSNAESERLLGLGTIDGAAGHLAETYQVLRPGSNTLVPEAQLPIVRALLNAEAVADEQLEILKPTGERIPLEVMAAPIFDLQTGLSGAIAVFRDVSERQRLQTRLLRAQKLEEVGRLSAGIAHEINTPLQYVGDNVRFLGTALTGLFAVLDRQQEALRELGPPEVVEELDTLRAQVRFDFLRSRSARATASAAEGLDAIGSIVSAMRDFSHEGAVGTLDPTVDVNRALRSTARVSKSVWKHLASVEFDLDEALQEIPGIAGELSQVFLNLIVNAAQAIASQSRPSDELGSIVLTSRREGDRARVSVQDDGGGIRPEHLDRVFDPFFTTKPVGIGTGQGLAIVHSLVARYAGEVRVESELGVGTTIHVLLPMERLAGEKS